LIGGEDGVSPGQACVFYEAAEGQARVLGGGVIAGTMASMRAMSATDAALAAVRWSAHDRFPESPRWFLRRRLPDMRR
jgi:tRNA-specific 2-thiouridylase